MRIALVQVASPGSESTPERRSRVADLLHAAAGADLIVLPELWDVGYFAFDRYGDESQPSAGPTVTALAEVARALGAFVHVGSFVERTPDGRLRNTAVLLDRRGQPVLRYSKVHVFGYQSREAELIQPGDSLDVTGTEFGALGTTTCYDLRFPELWRGLVDNGAELAVVPAAWPMARLEHWRLFTAARAVEQQILMIACNAVGEQGGVELAGHSRVIDPWGQVVVEADSSEGITFCEVDPAVVAAARVAFPVLRDRLPDYSALLGGSPIGATST